jgi:hypothetical protein
MVYIIGVVYVRMVYSVQCICVYIVSYCEAGTQVWYVIAIVAATRDECPTVSYDGHLPVCAYSNSRLML